MRYSLRKGKVIVHFEHQFGGDPICCKEFTVEQIDENAVIGMVLSPAGEFQLLDALAVFGDSDRELRAVEIRDDLIQKGLRSFAQHRRSAISTLIVQITFRGRSRSFVVRPSETPVGGLRLIIERSAT